jgi:phosphopantothenoylcysteine synthetase/decarboxylase
MHFLITSGGTREYIDPVRFISNASSGKMGLALTHAALKAGHKVTLISTNPKSQIRNPKLKVIEAATAAEMFNAVKRHFPKCDCLIMAAAVADYTPVHPTKTKIKRTGNLLTIKLKPTVDILKWAGLYKNSKLKHRRRLVIGFALEDKNLKINAEKKLKEKNLDMIIANTHAAISADKATVLMKTPNSGWNKIENSTKNNIAKRIIIEAEKSLN